ncbi:MAG: FliG C-terminal domain-containing protein [Bacteriovoracaceae bacterium]
MSDGNGSKENKIFLNGKAQIVELLKAMEGTEKEKLLRLISARNPSMARELQEKSFSFNNLMNLTDMQIKSTLSQVNSQIMGIALKGCHGKLQKRILTIAPRAYAEEAYETLLGPVRNEARDIERAQERVLAVVLAVLRRSHQTNA